MEHSSLVVFDCKVAKSSPFHPDNYLKRLYFNNFKELFIHFNGTLVNVNINISMPFRIKSILNHTVQSFFLLNLFFAKYE